MKLLIVDDEARIRALISKYAAFEGYETEEAENGEEVEKEIKKKKFWRFFSIVPALAAVIVFLLTEDMRLPMVFVDRWTLLMVIIGLVQALVMVFAKKTKKDPDEEEEAKA